MNYRDYKSFAPGSIHHIFNRGVGKTNIFLDNDDYKLFLWRLRENLFPDQYEKEIPTRKKRRGSIYVRKTLPPNSFDLICYCLMPNHFHFLIQQKGEVPVSKFISKICTGYSKNFNKKHGRIGGLFQDQFKAVQVDSNEYLLWVSAYIHQNPKVAGLVENLSDWQWSSFADYTGERKGTLCKKNILTEQFKEDLNYKDFVEDTFDLIKEKKEMEYLLLDDV